MWYSNPCKPKHKTTMKLNSFPRIVKFLLKDLPTNDHPVLNSRLFCSIWFTAQVLNPATKVHKLEAGKVLNEKFFRYK
jgi:hypothetical protein